MDVTEWLLDSDPSIRWQAMRDVTHAPSAEVAAERTRVAREGWGARLLDLQGDDGNWAGGAYSATNLAEKPEGFAWTATSFTLQQLREFGIDPADERVVRAIEQVAANTKWEHEGQDFFDGEVEPCINGMALAIGGYFGQESRKIVDTLLGDQMEDGGWNCEQERGSTRGSFDSTIAVLEGLLEHERAVGGDEQAKAARERGEAFLLDRHLMRRRSDNVIPNEQWLQFSYPTRYFFDVLRALDYLRSAGATPDDRITEALDLVESKRTADGRWLLENTHRGPVYFELDDGDGKPSRWNTLRALRVLEWGGR